MQDLEFNINSAKELAEKFVQEAKTIISTIVSLISRNKSGDYEVANVLYSKFREEMTLSIINSLKHLNIIELAENFGLLGKYVKLEIFNKIISDLVEIIKDMSMSNNVQKPSIILKIFINYKEQLKIGIKERLPRFPPWKHNLYLQETKDRNIPTSNDTYKVLFLYDNIFITEIGNILLTVFQSLKKNNVTFEKVDVNTFKFIFKGLLDNSGPNANERWLEIKQTLRAMIK